MSRSNDGNLNKGRRQFLENLFSVGTASLLPTTLIASLFSERSEAQAIIGLWKKSKTVTVVLSTAGAGSWPVPSNVRVLQTVECWGGGGGSTSIYNASYGGGGGGAYIRYKNMAIAPGTTSISYVVGGPGVGVYGAGTATAGGDTWFSSQTLAMAKGGSPSLPVADFAGGIGGQASASFGHDRFSGGTGGDANSSQAGGGAGGAGSLAGNGGNGGPGWDNGAYYLGGAGGSAYGTANGGAAGGAGGGLLSSASLGTQLGGGGGGGGNKTYGGLVNGGNGGFPGGGAGSGGYGTTGPAHGAQGQIIITYLIG